MKPRPPVRIRFVRGPAPALRPVLDLFARAAGHADLGALLHARPVATKAAP